METIMGQILIRQLDDAVIEAMKKRAKANNRSMNAEVRDIIERAVEPANGPTAPARRSIMEFAGSHPTDRTVEEIVAEIRALRDEWGE
jgi:plasmid stability protein